MGLHHVPKCHSSSAELSKSFSEIWGRRGSVWLIQASEVQLYGCGALGHFSGIDENRAHIADAGGIEAIIAALRVQAGNGTICPCCGAPMGCWSPSMQLRRDACLLLGSLAHDAEYQLRVAEAGGVEAVVAVLRGHRLAAEQIAGKYLRGQTCALQCTAVQCTNTVLYTCNI